MHVLEILNSYPGETFLREHASAVCTNSTVEISWGFWQTSNPGVLPKVIPELKHCIGLTNPNRISRWKKLLIKLRYRNSSDAYTRALIAQIKGIKPDLIHFQFASLALRHYQWVEELGIPFTFSIRGSDIQTETIATKETVDNLRVVFEKAYAIHSVCNHLKEELFRYCGENNKTVTIRTTINDQWRTIEKKPISGNLISIGRLHWRKSYSDLLLACHAVKKMGFSIKLTIIGEGEQRPLLEYMIRDLGLSDVVYLAGKLDHAEIKKHLIQADALLLSSIAEGFPNVAGEAAYSKTIIVATSDSNVSEVFEEKTHFLMSKTGNAEHLSQSIVDLLNLSSYVKNNMAEEAFKAATSAFSGEEHSRRFEMFWGKYRDQ